MRIGRAHPSGWIPPRAGEANESRYVLGPNDELVISVLGLEHLSDKRVRINAEGDIHLPLAGRVRAAGMTLDRLQAELAKRLGNYMQAPQVTVSVWQVGSQPVSVIGAVNRPGVHQAGRNQDPGGDALDGGGTAVGRGLPGDDHAATRKGAYSACRSP